HLEPWSPPVPDFALEPGGRRGARTTILATLEKWEEGSDFRFFIVLRSTGQIIGQIGLTNIIRGVSQSCFIGYWIGRPYINQGFATEAVVLSMQFAFEILKLHRISLWIAVENNQSLRITEKLGLRFEGTALRSLFLGGRWQDTHIFAMTLEEWRERIEELIRKCAY